MEGQITWQQVRAELEISEGTKILVFMYGGQPPGDWQLRADSLPKGWTCIVCSNGLLPGGKQLPHNFLLAAKDAYTPDLVRSALRIDSTLVSGVAAGNSMGLEGSCELVKD